MDARPSAESPQTEDRRTNNFGLLRVVLAGLVVVSHSSELTDGDRHRELLTVLFGTVSSGLVAVNGFFLISGFLIVKSWSLDPSLRDFLVKRVLRIVPGFAVASLVSVFVVGPLAATAPVSLRRLVAPTLWNVVRLHVPEYPVPLRFAHYPLLNGALWTVQFEFLMYLVAAALGILGLTRRRWPWLALFAVATALMLRNDLQGMGEDPNLPYAVPRFSAFFSMGALAYLYRERIAYRLPASIAAGFALAFSLLLLPYAQLGLLTLGAYLLFSTAFAGIPVVGRIGTRNDVSYGLYLYAWPVQQLLLLYIRGVPLGLHVLASLLLAGSLGFLSWRFVEGPCLRLKSRFARGASALEAAG